MSDLKLFFWAQSLDNQSPDLIFEDDEELFDDVPRQEIISKIYKVSGKKIEQSSKEQNSKVTTRFSDPKFVIETFSLEKDQVNRLAPIVIYGELPEELSNDWIERCCDEIDKVVTYKLDRTLSKDVMPTIREWLKEKKKRVELHKQSVGMITVVLVPLLMGWLLQSKSIHPTLLQVSGLMALNNFLILSVQTLVIDRSRRKIRIR